MLAPLREFIMPYKHMWQPERFHDPGPKRPYFEGWYYKIVSKDKMHQLAVIPGIFLDRADNSHCFIQMLDGNHKTEYLRYPVESFRAKSSPFCVEINKNHFSLSRLQLNIAGDGRSVQGEVHFEERNPWPVRLFSPGAMGWYAFVPTMECYHGVLSMNHALTGSLYIDDREIDFSGGRGYIEKDWGVSFPLAYIWLQSNHFQDPQTSIMVSIARIPWKSGAFRGFLAGFQRGSEFRICATYTGGVIDTLTINDDEVILKMHDRRMQIELSAKRSQKGGALIAPDGAAMHQHVSESLWSELTLTVMEKGEILFQGKGNPAALEVQGPLSVLQ